MISSKTRNDMGEIDNEEFIGADSIRETASKVAYEGNFGYDYECFFD